MMSLNRLKMIDSINLLKWFLDNQMKANMSPTTSKQSCTNLKIGRI